MNPFDSVENICNVGSINDSGVLRNLYRKGFTPVQCLSELMGNSIDAEANNILYSITEDPDIKIMDDGKGLTRIAIRDMFEVYKENHKGQKKLGVSGVGGKVATMILSKEKSVKMHTKSRNDSYYSITIPWDSMFREQKYSDMIKVSEMTDLEISNFCKERENMKNKDTGLTIFIPFNDVLVDEIEKQFSFPNDDIFPDCDMSKKLSVIYGGFPIDVKYQHFESKPKLMNKYNYFNRENNEYYLGKTSNIIHMYEKGNIKRYISNDNGKEKEIKKSGKGYSKNPDDVTESLNGWKHLGDYSVLVGCRRDENYFTERNTSMPDTAVDTPLAYDKEHFGDSTHESLYKTQLVRNNQHICSFDLPETLISNRRANAKSMFKNRHLKKHLSYDPNSDQDNSQDLVCGIQENKNQCSCLLPLPFLRLIQHIINKIY